MEIKLLAPKVCGLEVPLAPSAFRKGTPVISPSAILQLNGEYIHHRYPPHRRRLFPLPSLPFGESPAHSAVAARERSPLHPFAASRTVRLAEMLDLLPRLIRGSSCGDLGAGSRP